MKKAVIVIIILIQSFQAEVIGEIREKFTSETSSPGDEIMPYEKNPFYWQYKQKPIYLRGGSDNDNLWQWTGTRLTEHLDLLTSVGGNYVRNTMSDRDEGDVFAYYKLDNGKYNLGEWNQEYWDRLVYFLEETTKRGIIAQLTLWDCYDLSGTSFDKHPFNPKNNVNWEEGLVGGMEDFYGGSLSTDNQEVLKIQKEFVQKLLSVTLQFDNVLYNITNESFLSLEWEDYWAAFVQDLAQKNGKTIYITSMNIVASTGVRHVMNRRNLYSFVEISQNNQESRGARGKAHWENVVKWRRILELQEEGAMPMNNEKIYGSRENTNYSFGTGTEAEDRFWKNVFGGAASVRFHRPDGGMGLSERARININALSMFLEEFDIFSSGPYTEIDFYAESEGYALANIGKEFAVYLPAGRYSLELDPWLLAKKVSIKYLDFDSATWSEEETLELTWEKGLSEFFGYQQGIQITSPSNRPCIAVVRFLE
ncbi:hypothetical protein [Lunatibacter salilacus]|uniref:hypothetical protein n=1 Tax=Lunatibacter salilacus TaxID=2483804 RepID=UPI00131D9349|nr:hypothetical protein [Lunatibacter salilacus]